MSYMGFGAAAAVPTIPASAPLAQAIRMVLPSTPPPPDPSGRSQAVVLALQAVLPDPSVQAVLTPPSIISLNTMKIVAENLMKLPYDSVNAGLVPAILGDTAAKAFGEVASGISTAMPLINIYVLAWKTAFDQWNYEEQARKAKYAALCRGIVDELKPGESGSPQYDPCVTCPADTFTVLDHPIHYPGMTADRGRPLLGQVLMAITEGSRIDPELDGIDTSCRGTATAMAQIEEDYERIAKASGRRGVSAQRRIQFRLLRRAIESESRKNLAPGALGDAGIPFWNVYMDLLADEARKGNIDQAFIRFMVTHSLSRETTQKQNAQGQLVFCLGKPTYPPPDAPGMAAVAQAMFKPKGTDLAVMTNDPDHSCSATYLAAADAVWKLIADSMKAPITFQGQAKLAEAQAEATRIAMQASGGVLQQLSPTIAAAIAAAAARSKRPPLSVFKNIQLAAARRGPVSPIAVGAGIAGAAAVVAVLFFL